MPVCPRHGSLPCRQLGVVVARQPRQTELLRPDPYGAVKAVAANIDQIVLVVAPLPEPHASTIDRYLVAAEAVAIALERGVTWL